MGRGGPTRQAPICQDCSDSWILSSKSWSTFSTVLTWPRAHRPKHRITPCGETQPAGLRGRAGGRAGAPHSRVCMHTQTSSHIHAPMHTCTGTHVPAHMQTCTARVYTQARTDMQSDFQQPGCTHMHAPTHRHIYVHTHAWHRVRDTCRYAHMHAPTYMHIYTHRCTHAPTHMHVHTQTCRHTHMHTPTHRHVHTCIHMQALTFMHAHMHMRMHVHTYAHTHTHGHTRACTCPIPRGCGGLWQKEGAAGHPDLPVEVIAIVRLVQQLQEQHLHLVRLQARGQGEAQGPVQKALERQRTKGASGLPTAPPGVAAWGV